jgi:hypothetical protein
MLRCEDCDRESTDDELGWLAVIHEIDRDTGKRVVLIYCPDCADKSEDYGTRVSAIDP